MLRPQLRLVIKNLEILFNLLYCVIILKRYLDRQLGLHRFGFGFFSGRCDTKTRKFSILTRVTEMKGRGI